MLSSLLLFVDMKESGMKRKKLFDRMKESDFIEAFLYHHSDHASPGTDIDIDEAYVRGRDYSADIDRLDAGDYFFDVPVKKVIPKSLSDKKRTVYCFGGRQKLLLQAMSYALHDYDDIFPDCVYSSILGKNFKEYALRLRGNKHYGDMYAVKADISGYGGSIDTDILVDKLRDTLSEDPELLKFLIWLLKRREFRFEGRLMRGGTSALQGIPIHNFFTNLYLLDMDEKIRIMGKEYCRYSDDILVFAEDRDAAEAIMAVIREDTAAVKLSLNMKKTFIYEPHSRIEHMGICYEDGSVDLSDYSLYKLKRKMRIRTKRIRRRIEDGDMSPADGAALLTKLNNQTFFGRGDRRELSWSRWLFPILNDCTGLHKLDLYHQYCLRYMLTGKKGDASYRAGYEQLKEHGYISLVREYYRWANKGN